MNFYSYLGVSQNASNDEIKKAFRKMAKRKHPDLNSKSNAFWEMVELNLMRDTLLNPTKRIEYDKQLARGEAPTLVTYEEKRSKIWRMNNIYKSVKSLLIYRCRICLLEMNSTWQGYCLYHYLEITEQLNSHDQTFTYAGYTYRFNLNSDENVDSKTKSTNQRIKNTHIMMYLLFIVTFIIFIAIYYFYLINRAFY